MRERDENLTELCGTVEDVVYKNSQNGYVVLVLDCDGKPVNAVGNLGDIAQGEELRLKGFYVVNAKYGKQFSAIACERVLPTSEAGIRKYLASGIISGVGPALAKKIVTQFGVNTLRVIELEPYKLAQINGISKEKADFIGQEFRRQSGMKSVVEFLAKYDISPVTAALLWKLYEGESLSLVRENPYILCSQELDVDFEKADEIAADLELSPENTERVKAAITYVLRENSVSGGHTCLPLERLRETVCRSIDISFDAFDDALAAGMGEGTFDELEIKGRYYVFLRDYYRAETYIAKRLTEMLRLSVPLNKDHSQEISGVEWAENIRYEHLQKAAINAALGNNLFILTGGPGTGKTTTLNAVIQICKRKKKRLLLAAPTGRAAKRMSDLTGQPARTIHRLLEVEFNDKTGKLSFRHNENDPLSADVIIIDEMSMVDVLLFEALLRAIKPTSSLIMVGDSDQLPSVGAGNVLRDLIASKLIPTVELKEIFRQAAKSLIVTNAHRIVSGEMPELSERKNDFFFMSTSGDDETARLVIELTQTRLPRAYGYSPTEDIQVLSPTKLGSAGTKELNRSLQTALNPPSRQKKEIKFGDIVFRTGDKVMQIKNDYDVAWERGAEKGTGIFNGDIGVIVETDPVGKSLVIDFDGREACYTSDMFNRLEHAYAVTIHKSQGSEYRAVVMPLTMVSSQLLYRNLLYTGVTRAKELIIIIGSRQAVSAMVKNDKKTLRYSCIRALLEQEAL